MRRLPFLTGFEFSVDNFYMHSFEIWLATTVVFFGSGNVGFTILEYRLGAKSLLHGFLINLMWIPFLCVISSSFHRDWLKADPAPLQLLLLRRSRDPALAVDPRAFV